MRTALAAFPSMTFRKAVTKEKKRTLSPGRPRWTILVGFQPPSVVSACLSLLLLESFVKLGLTTAMLTHRTQWCITKTDLMQALHLGSCYSSTKGVQECCSPSSQLFLLMPYLELLSDWLSWQRREKIDQCSLSQYLLHRLHIWKHTMSCW